MKMLVIASVLKPVNDTRMYEKIGISLQESGKYNVNIIGCHAPVPDGSAISFWPLFQYHRITLSRLLAWWPFLRKLRQLQPDVVIVCTWELLPALLFYHCEKTIYDVQENFAANARAGGGIAGKLASMVIWFYERLAKSQIDTYTVSDQSYIKELGLPAGKTFLVRNTHKLTTSVNARQSGGMNLIFSGTISRTFGVFRAIELAKSLHAVDQSVKLKVIGFCVLAEDRHYLRKLDEKYAWLELEGIEHLVPHSEIIEAIRNSDYGLISYEHHPHIVECTPTRLYEYMAERLPILLTPVKNWVDLAAPYNAAILVNYDDFDAEEIYQAMQSTSFYPVLPKNVYWQDNLHQLLQAVK